MRLAFANMVRKPLVCKPRLASPTQFTNLKVCEPRLPRLPYGRLAMTITRCHCEERSDEAIYTFVIASLNALAFGRGNLFLNDRFCAPSFLERRDWLSPTHSPTQQGWRTRLAFANTFSNPTGLENEIGFRQHILQPNRVGERDWLSPTHSPTQQGWRTRLAFANTFSNPTGLENEIGFRQHGSQTFGLQTEIGFANAVHKPKGL